MHALFVLVIFCCAVAFTHARQPALLPNFSAIGGRQGCLVARGPTNDERVYISYSYSSFFEVIAVDPEQGTFTTWRSSCDFSATPYLCAADGNIYLVGHGSGCLARICPSNNNLTEFGVV